MTDRAAVRFFLTIRRFKHSLPCGVRRDPGPIDDEGVSRWHWCFAVTVDDRYSFYGRFDDVVEQLRLWAGDVSDSRGAN